MNFTFHIEWWVKGGGGGDVGRHYISVLISYMYIYNEYLREELYI